VLRVRRRRRDVGVPPRGREPEIGQPGRVVRVDEVMREARMIREADVQGFRIAAARFWRANVVSVFDAVSTSESA